MDEDGFKHISKLEKLNIAELGNIISRLAHKIGAEKI